MAHRNAPLSPEGRRRLVRRCRDRPIAHVATEMESRGRAPPSGSIATTGTEKSACRIGPQRLIVSPRLPRPRSSPSSNSCAARENGQRRESRSNSTEFSPRSSCMRKHGPARVNAQTHSAFGIFTTTTTGPTAQRAAARPHHNSLLASPTSWLPTTRRYPGTR